MSGNADYYSATTKATASALPLKRKKKR
jgi:hypothetical protein